MNLRLAKDGVYVLCGVIDCGARVGHLDHGRRLELMPGYRRDPDNVFRLTPRAGRRLRQGLSPRRSGRPTGRSWDPVPNAAVTKMPCCLPVTVKCYACGMVQLAEAEPLRADGHHWTVRDPEGRTEPHPSDRPGYWWNPELPRD